jgi:cytochrome b subunit of formate dehydrogenase
MPKRGIFGKIDDAPAAAAVRLPTRKSVRHGPAGTDQARSRYRPEISRTDIMSLITLIVILIVVGVLLWLINNYIPMDAKIKQILNAVVVIAVVLWLLQQFGLLAQLSNIHVGH